MCLSADRALECAVEKEEEMMMSCDVCTTSSNIGKKQNGRQYNVCIVHCGLTLLIVSVTVIVCSF